jgi:hypothetical protein
MCELRAAAALLCLGLGTLISACNGGGGTIDAGGGTIDAGGGTIDAGGGTIEGGLSISPTAVSFQVHKGDPLPTSQSIRLTITASDAVYAGFSFMPSKPSWLDGSLVGTGANASVEVRLTTVPPPGTYHTTLRVGIGRADRSIIATQDADVSVTVTDVLNASPSTLAFDAVADGPAPAALQVSVGGSGLDWAAAANQPWIRLGATSGTSPSTLAVSVDPTGLVAGPYSATLTLSRIGTTEKVTVEVALAVAAPAIQPGKANLSLSGVNGSAIPPATVDVSITNGNSQLWTATAADPWIVLQASSTTTPATLTVFVDPSRGPLASGAHASSIRLTSSSGDVTLAAKIPVTLSLTRPTLSATPASVAIGGALGRDLSAVPVHLALGTAPLVPLTWTAQASDAWIAPDATTGAVGTTAAVLKVGAATVGVAAGTHTGIVTFTAPVNGDVLTATLPVTLLLDARRLVASDQGVAFAMTGAGARLTRTLSVRDTFGGTVGWTASADQAWLTVTPSGTTPGQVTIQANPTGLATDTLFEGTVTLTADDASIPVETIRVGLWNGTAGQGTRSMAGTFANLEMDPIRPYVYVHGGGPDITVYNVYTGAVVKTLSHVAPVLGSLAASSDGARLYAEDVTNHRVVPIDLTSGTAETPWQISYSPGNLAYTRTSGAPVLFAGYGCAYHADTGASLSASPMGSWCSVLAATSVAGNRICGTVTGASPHDIYCRSIDYTAAQDRLVPGNQVRRLHSAQARSIRLHRSRGGAPGAPSRASPGAVRQGRERIVDTPVRGRPGAAEREKLTGAVSRGSSGRTPSSPGPKSKDSCEGGSWPLAIFRGSKATPRSSSALRARAGLLTNAPTSRRPPHLSQVRTS